MKKWRVNRRSPLFAHHSPIDRQSTNAIAFASVRKSIKRRL
ncbi:hypothetical protein C7S17_1175 [Burkholderia thailandensis]|nr:hypothetical protein [Burkholderia thailandensis]